MNPTLRWTMVAVVLIGWAGAGALAQQKKAPAKAADLVRSANESWKKGDLAKAAATLETARKASDFLSSRPDPQLLFAVGDFHFSRRTLEESNLALEVYELAQQSWGRELSPTNSALMRLHRSEVLSWQGRSDSAREEIAALRTQFRDNRQVQLIGDLASANLLLVAGQADAARDALRPLAELDDNTVAPLALFSLGRAYVQLKQPTEAVEAFRTLWNRYGETPLVKRAVFLIGQVYFDRGDFHEARKLYEACGVVGAAMQTAVRPGDELIVKVNDPDHFARTRSDSLVVELSVPSGDRESLRLERNALSEQLYTGRIQTALLAASPQDGLLQVCGADRIRIGYEQQRGKPFEVNVVDDGSIQIDSLPLPVPTPRHEQRAKAARDAMAREKSTEQPPELPDNSLAAAKVSSGAINPGGPVFVQVIDADLDATDQPDAVTVEVFASGSKENNDSVKVTLTETGPRTGVFAGSVLTEPSPVMASSGSSATGHSPDLAIDEDANTSWRGKAGEKSDYLEIDLRQPAFLTSLRWTSPEKKGKGRVSAMNVVLRGDQTQVTIPVEDASGGSLDLRNTFARYVRLVPTRFDGDAPSFAGIEIIDAEGRRLAPPPPRPDAKTQRATLTFDVGQQVSARYTDEENMTPGAATLRQSRGLGAKYHDARLSFAAAGALEADRRVTAWKLREQGRWFVAVSDPDADSTPRVDRAVIRIQGESGDKVEVEADEIGPSAGTFVAGLPLATTDEARANPRLLFVRPGDVIWATFLDDRNLHPGYRAFRDQWILLTTPAAGEFSPGAAQVSAAPRAAPVAEGQASAAAFSPARINVQFADPDAVIDGDATVAATVNALLSGAKTELTLRAQGEGVATGSLELILGEPQAPVDPAGEAVAGAASPGGKLSVPGDEILRFSASDEAPGKSDLQVRPVASGKAIEALGERRADGAAVATIRLMDGARRVKAGERAALDDLRVRLGQRLDAYQRQRDAFAAFRRTVEKRVAASVPATTRAADEETWPDTGDAVARAQLASAVHQTELLEARITRLTQLGAVASAPTAPLAPTAPTAPTAAPAAPAATRPVAGVPSIARGADDAVLDGPIIPGEPFEITVVDPDITADQVTVRLRSMAGRLVEVVHVQAKRQGDLFRARVTTAISSEPGKDGILSLVPGGEVIADYVDPEQPQPPAAERVRYVTLASDASMRVMNAHYTQDLSRIRVGQEMFVQITDFDADLSGAQDVVLVRAAASEDQELIVALIETEPHSGVFRGSVRTDVGAPRQGDDRLRVEYAGTVRIAYDDALRLSADSPATIVASLTVAGGTDGSIDGFSRQFRDSRDEIGIWFRSGQAAYEVGRQLYLAGAISRASDYLLESAESFQQIVQRFPDDPLASSASYYLGNVLSLRGQPREALARFQDVITRWPSSEFASKARFKIGQCHEELGEFDKAADAYVLLTYHHPDDPQVPLAMIRMMNHHARDERWDDAVAIARKFVERFPKHPRAGAVALKAGQWLTVGGDMKTAVAWYTSAEKTFAAADADMPALLYWHAAALMQGGGRGNDKVGELLNRIVYDYPRSEYVTLARIALDQMRNN